MMVDEVFFYVGGMVSDTSCYCVQCVSSASLQLSFSFNVELEVSLRSLDAPSELEQRIV